MKRTTNTIADLEDSRCTGCYACSNLCPTDAIGMESDEGGFPRPSLNWGRCITCGRCARSCPVLSPSCEEESVPQSVYAAWSLNESIRYESTSGGVFSELALFWLSEGGVVCGAEYDDRHVVRHVVIDSVEGLERLRQSKYAQSEIGQCYREIKKRISEGERVLFCGAPCQCAGLVSVLGGKTENLMLVNFVCRGTNSPKVYASFLAWLERRFGSRVSRVWFKNKAYGWRRFSTRVEFENGLVYSEDKYHDLFIRGYIEQNLYMRDCCYSCEFRNPARTADITLADFWGVQLADKSNNTDLGTSMVMLNTSHGEDLFEKIKPHVFWEQKTMHEAFSGNACIVESPVPNPNRSYFLSHLDELPFGLLCAECFVKGPLSERVKAVVKRVVKELLRKVGISR
ncbi:Coenzyme F420 hydrogenase/dehydrogenase, beta subunit C-terminal domain [Rubneribacter sp.]